MYIVASSPVISFDSEAINSSSAIKVASTKAGSNAHVIACFPNELVSAICLFLPAEDLLCNIQRVCRRWRVIVQDQTLWCDMYARDKLRWSACCSGDSDTNANSHAALRLLRSIRKSGNAWGRNIIKFVSSKTSSLLDGTTIQQRLHQQQIPSPPPSPPTSNSLSSKLPLFVVDWKRQYRVQHSEHNRLKLIANNNPSNTTSTGPSMLSEIRMHSIMQRVYKIPMFGEGLETNAKNLVYAMLYAKNPLWTMTGMFSGVAGIGSGMGFSINNKKLCLAVMHKWEERGIFEKVMPVWKGYFENADGFIYVIDSVSDEENTAVARKEISLFIHTSSSSNINSNNKPLLILACRPTIATSEDSNKASSSPHPGVASPAEIADLLQLHEIHLHKWCVRSICPKTLDGLAEGLHWISSNIN
eukprot:GEZU01033945.1.p1 GENE.GEZU01033945.1~~GEZU01033945.1.p1  ORF type:complete len:415 (+),score=91.86 GEZU01033945.1:110-1354(+)